MLLKLAWNPGIDNTLKCPTAFSFTDIHTNTVMGVDISITWRFFFQNMQPTLRVKKERSRHSHTERIMKELRYFSIFLSHSPSLLEILVKVQVNRSQEIARMLMLEKEKQKEFDE